MSQHGYAGELCEFRFASSTTLPATALKYVVSINGISMEREIVDNTVMAGTAKEYRGSKIPDAGMWDVEIIYDPGEATHQQIQNWFLDGSINNFAQALRTSGANLVTCQGIVKKFDVTDMAVGAKDVHAKIEIKLTGLPVFATAGY